MVPNDIARIERLNSCLKASASVATLLLKNKNIKDQVGKVLEIVGRAASVSHSYWFEKQKDGSGNIIIKQRSEWRNEGILKQINNSWLQDPAKMNDWSRWHKELLNGNIISGSIADFPDGERIILESKEIKSIVIIPLVIQGSLEGFIGFENRDSRNKWSDAEVNLFCSAVNSLAKAFENEKCKADRARLQNQKQHLQKMGSVGELVSGISHNFRNILAAIMTNSQLIQMKYKDDHELSNHIDSIINLADTGCDLIGGLLKFSGGGTKEGKDIFNLSEVLEETYKILSSSFDKRIEIKKKWPELLLVEGNRSQLIQVFMNLCTNARDAMVDGGLLRMEGMEEDNGVEIIISDTGCGMDEETAKRIFNPLFTTKDPGKGTGLGLSTAYSIIEDHNGKITVRSQPGFGTSFKVTLPPPKTQLPDEKEPSHQVVPGKGHKILIVDDDGTYLQPMEEALRNIGYRTASADSGEKSIKEYSSWRPDVVLMDRNMPGMDGLTISEHILSLDPGAKIVIISGYEEDGPDGINDRIKSLVKGYITKPFDIAEVSRILAKAVENEH